MNSSKATIVVSAFGAETPIPEKLRSLLVQPLADNRAKTPTAPTAAHALKIANLVVGATRLPRPAANA